MSDGSREAGAKAAAETAPVEKTAGKAPAKKTVAKKAPAKRTAAKKTAAKKTAANQTAAKKTAAKKTAAKKTAANQTAAKKTAANQTAAKKTAAKKTAAKKTAAKKTATEAASSAVAPTGRAAPVRRVRETVAGTVKATTATAAATGKAVVERAAEATRRPVEAGRALVGRAGERVADAGRAVWSPSSQFFAAAQTRATGLLGDPAALRGVVDQAMRSGSGRSGPLAEVADDLRTLGRLVVAYSRGEYREIPLDSLMLVVVYLVYVASPLDLVPESVPVAGVADDALAVGFVVRQVHQELQKFREWEAKPASQGD